MKNYDEPVEINHGPNWPFIPDHPYRVLIIAWSVSDKTNLLLNLVAEFELLMRGRELKI